MLMIRRRPGIASVAVLSGVSAALVLAQAVAPEWSHRAGLDVWNAGAIEADLRAAEGRGDELAIEQEQLRWQIEASELIVSQLIAGEASLADVADEVTQINRSRPGFNLALRLNYPGAASDRELGARHTLDRVQRRLASDPTHRAEVMARLEAELRTITHTMKH